MKELDIEIPGLLRALSYSKYNEFDLCSFHMSQTVFVSMIPQARRFRTVQPHPHDLHSLIYVRAMRLSFDGPGYTLRLFWRRSY